MSHALIKHYEKDYSSALVRGQPYASDCRHHEFMVLCSDNRKLHHLHPVYQSNLQTRDTMQGIVLEAVTKSDLVASLQDAIKEGFEQAGVDMLVTTQEAARIIGVSESTIRNYHASGKLKSLNPGRYEKYSLRQVITLKRSLK